MSSKRIEQLIDDIYAYLESCKPIVFKNTKITVEKDIIYDYLDELRLKIPEEIKRCQQMFARRDAIINDAETKAVEIVNAAKEQAQRMVQESEIMRQAYSQANEMVQAAEAQARESLEQANAQADAIQHASLNYTNDMLAEIEGKISQAYEEIRVRSQSLVETMQQNLEIIAANRRELNGEDQPAQLGQGNGADAKDDYDFDENTFLPSDMDDEDEE